jgi:hypothetical protein
LSSQKIVAGAEHSAALDDSGTVYSWGSGRQGQLGGGGSSSSSSGSSSSAKHDWRTLIPRPILSLHGVRIVQLASGGNHVLALADDGSAYSWGSGKNGRLGHSSSNDEPRPKRISALGNRTLAVACVRYLSARSIRHNNIKEQHQRKFFLCVANPTKTICAVRVLAHRVGRIRWRLRRQRRACSRNCFDDDNERHPMSTRPPTRPQRCIRGVAEQVWLFGSSCCC